MGNMIPVTFENFKNKSWKKPENMLFAKSTYLIPVTLHEINHLLVFLPLLFIKDDKERFRLFALLNLLPQGSLFINEQGQWLGRYIPWFFSAYPFNLGFTDKGEPVLLIDEDCVLSDNKGIPFFNEKGELNEEVNKIFQFLMTRERGYEFISEVCAQLAQLDLFESVSIKLKIGKEEKTVHGLYRIGLEKYTNLQDERVLELRKSGAFIVIYGHLFSLVNLDVLINLIRLQASQTGSPPIQTRTESRKTSAREKSLEEELFINLEESLKSLKFPEKK